MSAQANSNPTPLAVESDAVRAYLPMIQSVITRLAGNSASCKTWCVTLISALTVLAIDKGRPNAILVAFIPAGVFFFLDAYYLSLERDFRDLYNGFVKKLHNGQAFKSDLYVLKPEKYGLIHRTGAMISTIFSLSITPFYGVLLLAIWIARRAISQ